MFGTIVTHFKKVIYQEKIVLLVDKIDYEKYDIGKEVIYNNKTYFLNKKSITPDDGVEGIMYTINLIRYHGDEFD